MFEKLRGMYKRVIDFILPNRKKKLLDTGVTYEDIVRQMEEKGLFQEFQEEIKNFEEIEELMRGNTNLHGINHIIRVLFNVYALASMENVSEEEKRVLVEAAKLHDIGRIGDGEDEQHGEEGAKKAKDILRRKEFSEQDIDLICFLIKEHSLPRSINDKDINSLPENKRDRYRDCLDLLKDADKLDRVRLNDLNPKRLITKSAKKLVGVARDLFVNNRHYYKKKMKVYQFDEEEAQKILQQIKEVNPELDIDVEEIKKNYNKYKVIQEQGKIEWFKHKNKEISLEEFLEIISILSKEDVEYIREEFINMVGVKTIIEAISTMGIKRFIGIKVNGDLRKIFHAGYYWEAFERMPEEQKKLIMDIKDYDSTRQIVEKFYLYYNVVKNGDETEKQMLCSLLRDTQEYLREKRKKESGYMYEREMFLFPIEFEIRFMQKIDKNLLLDIRQKFNIPLNVIFYAIVEMNLLNVDLEREKLEKIVLNYYRLHLDVQKTKDPEQAKKLLLDLPEDINEQGQEKARECIIGKFKILKLEKFEQVKECEKICDQRILEEFEKEEDILKVKKLILQTKIRDLSSIKRDLHFYKKYLGEKSKENKIFNLFETLLNAQDKEQLFLAYNELNNESADFEFDNLLESIRKELAQISKTDVVEKMKSMKKKIESSPTKKINGQQVVDLTGTDFNLLISVIGANGSPYLVEYMNRQIRKLRQYENNPKVHKRKKIIYNIRTKVGTSIRVAKRYILDPKKNRQRCTSSIDQDFIGHISSVKAMFKNTDTKEKLILVYFPEDEGDIFYMGNDDLASEYDKERTNPERKRIPHKDNMARVCNMKLEDLNATTTGNDNEVIIDAYPGAIICFDEVSNIARITSQRMKIPILYIDSKKQFEIIKAKIEAYYNRMEESILQCTQLDEKFFTEGFNPFETNIIHEAFKIALGFSFMDLKEEYPKQQVQEIFGKMKYLVVESLKRCNEEQRKTIRTIMKKEADSHNARYGPYDVIDYEGLLNLVLPEGDREI